VLAAYHLDWQVARRSQHTDHAAMPCDINLPHRPNPFSGARWADTARALSSNAMPPRDLEVFGHHLGAPSAARVICASHPSFSFGLEGDLAAGSLYFGGGGILAGIQCSSPIGGADCVGIITAHAVDGGHTLSRAVPSNLQGHPQVPPGADHDN